MTYEHKKLIKALEKKLEIVRDSKDALLSQEPLDEEVSNGDRVHVIRFRTTPAAKYVISSNVDDKFKMLKENLPGEICVEAFGSTYLPLSDYAAGTWLDMAKDEDSTFRVEEK